MFGCYIKYFNCFKNTNCFWKSQSAHCFCHVWIFWAMLFLHRELVWNLGRLTLCKSGLFLKRSPMFSNFWDYVIITDDLWLGLAKWRGHWHCWLGRISLLCGVRVSSKLFSSWKICYVRHLCWKFLILVCLHVLFVTPVIIVLAVFLSSSLKPVSGIRLSIFLSVCLVAKEIIPLQIANMWLFASV